MLKNIIRDPLVLLKRLELDQNVGLLAAAKRSSEIFPLRVTPDFVEKMEKGNIDDPLLRQVLPILDELEVHDGFTVDPVAEAESFIETKGLVRKYKNRALIMATGACAIHCRYCFRRHFPYAENAISDQHVTEMIQTIENHKLSEIILSGGDPLMLSTEKLAKLIDRCSLVPSIKTVRVHTRLPVVLPERIDGVFAEWWNHLPFKKVMVIHANHPNELDEKLAHHLAALENTLILNQTVLLKGVNDSVADIVTLNQRCFEFGIQPYYLHLLDKVEGAAHFNVSESEALKLMEGLRAELPGYLVPTLVREEPGANSKTVIV